MLAIFVKSVVPKMDLSIHFWKYALRQPHLNGVWTSTDRVARPAQSFRCLPPGQGRNPSFYLTCRTRVRSDQFQPALREQELEDPLSGTRSRGVAHERKTLTTGKLFPVSPPIPIDVCRSAAIAGGCTDDQSGADCPAY